MSMVTLKMITLCAGMFVLIFADVACAYLDPGTGSFLFQMLLAGMVGMAVTVKIFWRTIKAYLAGLFGKKQDQDDDKQ